VILLTDENIDFSVIARLRAEALGAFAPQRRLP
jgi:hypothetical protein